MSCVHSSNIVSLATEIPESFNGWNALGPDETYTPENLYEYIDGGAELYRAFNVQQVLARRYIKEDAPEIIVDIFDMGSSEDAFGVYHHSLREGPDVDIGKDSEFLDTALYFWKGRFFVSIITLGDTEDTHRAMLEIGKSIGKAIPDAGSPPHLVTLLNIKNANIAEVHFFHNHLILNNYYYISDENILHLGEGSEGVLARYNIERPEPTADKEITPVALVIQYRSDDRAEQALTTFTNIYIPDADTDGYAHLEDQKWAAVEVYKNHLIAVFDTPSREVAQDIKENIIENLHETVEKE